MRKKIAIALTAGVAAATVGLGAAGTASAAPKGPTEGGIACMQYGHSQLRGAGSPAKASLDLVGLPLNEVLALHRTSPGAAAYVLINVVGLPDSEVVPACGEPVAP